MNIVENFKFEFVSLVLDGPPIPLDDVPDLAAALAKLEAMRRTASTEDPWTFFECEPPDAETEIIYQLWRAGRVAIKAAKCVETGHRFYIAVPI